MHLSMKEIKAAVDTEAQEVDKNHESVVQEIGHEEEAMQAEQPKEGAASLKSHKAVLESAPKQVTNSKPKAKEGAETEHLAQQATPTLYSVVRASIKRRNQRKLAGDGAKANSMPHVEAKADDLKRDDTKAVGAKADDANIDNANTDDAKETSIPQAKANDPKAHDAEADDAKADNAKTDDAETDDAKADDAKAEHAMEADVEAFVNPDTSAIRGYLLHKYTEKDSTEATAKGMPIPQPDHTTGEASVQTTKNGYKASLEYLRKETAVAKAAMSQAHNTATMKASNREENDTNQEAPLRAMTAANQEASVQAMAQVGTNRDTESVTEPQHSETLSETAEDGVGAGEEELQQRIKEDQNKMSHSFAPPYVSLEVQHLKSRLAQLRAARAATSWKK